MTSKTYSGKFAKIWNNRLGKLSIIGFAAFIFFCCIIILLLPKNNDQPEQDISAVKTQAFETAYASLITPTAAQSPTPKQPPTATQPPPPTKTPIPSPTTNPNIVSPGMHLVGTDLQPGLYMGQTGEGRSSCYWQRLKGLSGTLDDIIANDNGEGRYYIEVRPSDYALETRCTLLYLPTMPAPVDPFPQNILPGTYLVNIDIQPGTYQGQAGTGVLESCYWARLSNVAGGFNGILANDNAVGQYYVQISPSDFAFHTACNLTRIGN